MTLFPIRSHPRSRASIACLLGCGLLLGALHADEILLGSSGKISGSLQSMDSATQLSVQSPLAPNPLEIPASAVDAILFTPSTVNSPPPPQLLQLTNGDQLPAEIIELDAASLTYRPSWPVTGKVPREAMLSLHFDAANAQILYAGPQKDDWQVGKAWKIEQAALVSQAWGPAHRQFEHLPDRYVIDFHVEWTGNAGFKFLIASNNPDGNTDTDAYFLQFNSAGLELKRQMSQPRKYISLATFNDLTPDQFEESTVHFTIRIDRSNRLLQLAINGKDIRRTIIDPNETGAIPKGSFYSFLSTTGQDDQHRISKIQFSTWPSGSVEARKEKRPTSDRDTLYDVDSNRISGKLLAIKPGNPPSILFENPHDPSPQPLPTSQVAVIHFSHPAQPLTELCYRIELRHQGVLHLPQFILREAQLLGTHPLLGPIAIPREHILSIKKHQP